MDRGTRHTIDLPEERGEDIEESTHEVRARLVGGEKGMFGWEFESLSARVVLDDTGGGQT